MFKMKAKAMSLVLAFVMALGMAVPAFAADGSLTVNGRQYTGENPVDLATIGTQDIESVTVESGSYSKVYDALACKAGGSDTLPNGSVYQIYNESIDGVQIVKFRINGALKDVVTVSTVMADAYYSLNVNSGFYGQNSNQGGVATCTYVATTDGGDISNIKGGNRVDVDFTPNSGQEIIKLNVRFDYMDAASNILDATTGSKTIQGVPFSITKSGNSVQVSYSASRNVYISALTQDETKKITLTVNGGSNYTANVSSEVVPQGTTKTITFTPTSGYNVGEVSITDGGKSGTISLQSSSANVNGKTYSLTRSIDGIAVLSVPAMTDDVTVSAAAASDINYIKINDGRWVSSDNSGLNFVRDGQSFSFIYETSSTAIIQNITVWTPSLGEHTYSIGSYGSLTNSNGDFIIHGNQGYDNYYGNNLSIYHESNGDLRVLVSNVSENMEFSVNGQETAHKVVIKPDNGIDTSHDEYIVDDGDDLTVTFTPAMGKYVIRTLRINYGGSAYTVDVGSDKYVTIDGNRWYVTVDTHGVVTLNMDNIRESVTVTATSNYTNINDLRITKNEDSHSNITFTGSNPFNSNESTTIRVYTDNNYILDKVTFKIGSRSVDVRPFDNGFTLDGKTYTVVWTDSGEFSVYFAGLTGNLTVTSKSERGTTEQPPYVGPIAPSGTAYHPAYMVGYGNGYFGVNDNLTRAQAVVMLTRAVKGMTDASVAWYAGNQHFNDVPANAWYAGSVNYAAANGYLNILTANGRAFSPNAPISRAEYLALLCVFQGVNISGTNNSSRYSDVPSSHWAVQYINHATAQGWVQGTGSGLFMPDRAVTRAEICVMTNHALGRTADYTQAAMTGPTFNDVPISHYAYYDIFEASRSHSATYANGYETWS